MRRTYLQNINLVFLSDLENKFMVMRAEGFGRWVDRELGTDIYRLLCLKWITNEELLYST